jgi:hypothetical protein
MQPEARQRPGREQQQHVGRQHQQIGHADRQAERAQKAPLAWRAVHVAHCKTIDHQADASHQQRHQRAQTIDRHAGQRNRLWREKLPEQQQSRDSRQSAQERLF